MKLKLFGRGSQWAPTVLVLIVVALAGGRLITLSVQQRAEQMRETAQQRVAQYSRSIETQLRTLASDAAKNGARPELDQLLSRLPLSRVIDPEYDFALSKIDVSGGPPRVFVSSRIDALDDGVANVIRVPAGFSQDLPTGYLELAVRPKSGWYPARDLALAVGLLASVAWLLAFATHDLVHSLHRARDALAHSRRQLQIDKSQSGGRNGATREVGAKLRTLALSRCLHRPAESPLLHGSARSRPARATHAPPPAHSRAADQHRPVQTHQRYAGPHRGRRTRRAGGATVSESSRTVRRRAGALGRRSVRGTGVGRGIC